MQAKEDFEFLNSEVWLRYTQERYLPLEEIKFRLEKLYISHIDWPNIAKKIQNLRKLGGVPLFFESIDKKFWFFPSDCLNKKINQIEILGNKLFEKIERHGTFKNEFLSNSSIEEALTSAIYEGANTTRSKAKEFIALGKKPKNKAEWMVVNNYLAMKWIKDNYLLPVTKEVILKIHEIVTKNTLDGDDEKFCGKFRDDVVFVGNHQGIDHNLISYSLDQAIQLTTNNPRYLHGIIQGILLHYFIAYIHPFFDGNGRSARSLFYFIGFKNNLNYLELISISAHLKEHGKRYEKSFDLVKEHELDISYFIDFCLDSLIFALGKIEEKINYLIKISNLKDSLALSPNQTALLQKMALNKYKGISIEEYGLSINKSREVSRKNLKDLVRKGLLREEKIGKRYIYYVQSKKLKETALSSTL